MKEICVDGELYVRKKDMSIFLNEQPRYKRSYDKYYNFTKDVLRELINEYGKGNCVYGGVLKVSSDDFKAFIKRKGIRETTFLKSAFEYGFVIKNSQNKYRHNSSVDGVKGNFIKINTSNIMSEAL